MSTTLLIQNGLLVRDGGIRRQDVLITHGKIISVKDKIDSSAIADYFDDIETVDAAEQHVIPGLVDSHLHLLGGGGSEGFHSRIPTLPVTAALEAGITSCINMPGVDNVSKTMTALLAESERYNTEGVKTHTLLGGFLWPFETLTRAMLNDLYIIPQLIGVKGTYGEPLASPISRETLTSVLRDLKWIRLMTGKAAILHLHLGQQPGDPGRLLDAMEKTALPAYQVQLTHVNFSTEALEFAIEMGKRRVLLDINPLINPRRVPTAIDPGDAYMALEEAGIDTRQISLSSDGNASMPRVLPDGTQETFTYQLNLLETLRSLEIDHGKKFEDIIATVTSNPANNWRLQGVGALDPGNYGDVVILDDEGRVSTVIASGEVKVRDGVAVRPDRYRDPRWPK